MKRLRPYFRLFRTVRRELIIAIACGIIYGAASGAGLPAMIEYVFPRIFPEAGEPEREMLPARMVFLVAAALPLLFLVRALASYGNSYFTQLAGVRMLEEVRLTYFRKLQVLPLSFVHGKSTGDLISRGLSDTAQLQHSLSIVANDGIKQPATLIAALIYVASLAFRADGVVFALLCLAAVPLTVFPVRFVGRKVIKRAAQLQAQLGGVTSRFSENLAAAREVRAFGLEQRETGRFAAACRELIVSQMKIAKYALALTPAIEVVAAVSIAATLIYAHRSGLTLTDFVALITALYASYDPIKKLGILNNELKRGSAALERLEVVLEEPLAIADAPDARATGRLKGAIDFEDVTFAYKAGLPALREIQVRIPAGTVCALVGPSGAGKSTFANLVPRFYEATAGSVRIDGFDVRSLRLADLRRNIAVVSQDPVLFDESILENLLLGRPDASRAEVEQAARNAFAHDFIAATPQGYDTVIGERGNQLSGGQKQRLAIARAFLRNAPILILDEATSALDSESEAAIQSALHKLVFGKTVLIIAHRFSTIRDATLILVFDQGRIVAQGSHAELHAGNALYRSLYDRQRSDS